MKYIGILRLKAPKLTNFVEFIFADLSFYLKFAEFNFADDDSYNLHQDLQDVVVLQKYF